MRDLLDERPVDDGRGATKLERCRRLVSFEQWHRSRRSSLVLKDGDPLAVGSEGVRVRMSDAGLNP